MLGGKNAATIEKYARDVRTFAEFVRGREIDKALVLDYKNALLDRYTVNSANSMLAALNAFFRFYGWFELTVKHFRVQREAFCTEEKELSCQEYMRLVSAANRCGDDLCR